MSVCNASSISSTLRGCPSTGSANAISKGFRDRKNSERNRSAKPGETVRRSEKRLNARWRSAHAACATALLKAACDSYASGSSGGLLGRTGAAADALVAPAANPAST
eukprot:9269769-Pyramimonas_sp.AAC.1